MSEVTLSPYQLPPIAVVGTALPDDFHADDDLEFEFFSLDAISAFEGTTFPLVILNLLVGENIAEIVDRVQTHLKPHVILLLAEPTAYTDLNIPDELIEWHDPATLSIKDVERLYATALHKSQAMYHYSHQLTEIFAMHHLKSDSQIYQELQAVGAVLNAESIAVAINGSSVTRLVGVHIGNQQNFNFDDYTIVPSSPLETALASQELQTLFHAKAAKSHNLFDELQITHASCLRMVPVDLNGVATAALLIASDLSEPTLGFLTPSFKVLAQRVATSVEQRAREQQYDRESLRLEMISTSLSALTTEDVLMQLCDTIEQISTVRQVIVWQSDAPMPNEYITRSTSQAVIAALELAIHTTYFDGFIADLNAASEPIYLQRHNDVPEPIHLLYDALRTDVLVLLPLNSHRALHRLVIVAPLAENLLQDSDVQFMHLLVETAEQVIAQFNAPKRYDSPPAWFDALTYHMQYGFCHMTKAGAIDYANNPFCHCVEQPLEAVLGQDFQAFFSQLAPYEGISLTDNTDVPIKLLSAVTQQSLWLSLVHVGTDGGWLGIVQQEANSESSTTPFADLQSRLISQLPVQIAANQSRAVSLLRSLATSANFSSDVRHTHILNNVLDALNQMGNLAEDVQATLALQEPPTGDIQANPTAIDLEQLIQDVLAQATPPRQVTTFHVTQQTNNTQVQINNEHDVSSVFERLLRFLAAENPTNAGINITFSHKPPFTNVHIAHRLPQPTYTFLEHIVYSTTLDADALEHDLGASLSLYIARELIQREQGFMTVDANEIVISLPTAAIEPDPAHLDVDDFFAGELVDVNQTSNTTLYPVETIVICIGESEIVRETIDILREAGYELSVQRNIADSLWYLDQQNSCDLIVMDDSLRGEDPLEFARAVRKRTRVPIVLMGDTRNIARADVLQHEIDTYLTQPITRDVMLLEIKAMIRRNPDIQDEPIRIRDLEIDLLRYTVTLNAEPVDLTRLEYKLLRVLAINAGQVLEYEQLLRRVWGPEYLNDRQHLYTFINRLRKKLERKDSDDRYIHTRSGVGYILR